MGNNEFCSPDTPLTESSEIRASANYLALLVTETGDVSSPLMNDRLNLGELCELSHQQEFYPSPR